MNIYGFLRSTFSYLLFLGSATLGQVESACRAGCNLNNGHCEKNGECRCRPGWQGATCEQCIPFPGCVHGTCKKAWQCICELGWVGRQCDQDHHLCLSKPCFGNSTCIETRESGYICICPPGYTGKKCQLKKRPCLTNRSPCQNGGSCTENGFSDHYSCLCPPGFTGDFCETDVKQCVPNPCLNGGTCTDHGITYICICPPTFSGLICNITLGSCSDSTCGKGGTCLNDTDGETQCVCPPGLTGHACDIHTHSLKPKAKPKSSGRGHLSQDYRLPAHAFHKLLTPSKHQPLTSTLKETVHTSSPLDTHNQMICFAVLGLLTCLVVLGTTGIIFFNRWETWLSNVKYSQLVQQQRKYLLNITDSENNSVNIILPEKIRLMNYEKHYASI